ncbi:RNA polymerase sigma factor [Komagataeibacter melomenusus]|uniref:RNA polymerase sigma factor n=1 Tax=Komagataeibacter melomenusus TaxID=2766578 RepID=UPI0023EF40B2
MRSLTRRYDAEDHLQSAFVKYLERPDGSIGHPEAYITRSAVNLSHNARRREQVGCIAPGGWDDTLGDARDTAPTQEEVYHARERMIRFHAGCQRLPRRTRQAFVLHRVEKMTYRDIARLMDISESSVEKHIARALVFLSAWMAQ